MKKTTRLLAFMLMIALTITVMGDTAVYKDFPSLRIIAEEVSPEPVEPGQDVTVKVRIYNYPVYGIQGNDDTTADATVRLDVKYPFYLKAESRSSDDCNICTGCSKDYTYYLVVDSNAASGIYPVTIKVTRGHIEREEDINIKVIGAPDIIFESHANGEKIKAGDGFSITAQFKNIGTGIARNIKITPLSEKFIMLGSGMKIIDAMKPGEEVDLVMSFSVDESVSPGAYAIPVQLTFIDERSGRYTLSENLGIKIVHDAELGLQNIKITPANNIKTEDIIEVQLRIENIGDGNAENVKIILESELEGNKVAYLGRIEKDSDEPTIFTLAAGGHGEINNKIRITYRDDFGEHELTEEFIIYIDETEKTDQLLLFGLPGIIIAAVVVGGLMRKNKTK